MKVSVVCPFFNEEAILENAVGAMLANLASLEHEWELIIVNDGSTDGSAEIARKLEQDSRNLRVVGYEVNQGRGYAIRTGIEAANGEIVVTTEVDCSWGDDIVHRLVKALLNDPSSDIVIASPNLPGGGYRNVPARRVLISRLGNTIIRAAHSRSITMYTGMTRAYRRKKFLILPLDEKGKEFHLEVARKAFALGLKITEIPAVLEWKDHKFARPGSAKRKSSSRIPTLMRSHLLFSMVAAPLRYILPVSVFTFVLASIYMIWAIWNLFTPQPSIFVAIISLFLYLFSGLILMLGAITHQGQIIQKELWLLRGKYQERGD